MSVSTTLAFIKLSNEKEETHFGCMKVVNVFIFVGLFLVKYFPLRS
jgi:hypothetical protein